MIRRYSGPRHFRAGWIGPYAVKRAHSDAFEWEER